jgi:hypothetical protein
MLRSVIALALAAATFALRFTPQPASFEEWRSIHGKWYATAAESQARQVRQLCRLSLRRECRHPTDAWGTQAVFEENRAFVLRHNAEALAGSKTYSVHLCPRGLSAQPSARLQPSASACRYSVTLNKFADLSRAEFAALLLRPRPKTARRMAASAEITRDAAADLPIAVDWRGTGAVTSVKNQGKCVPVRTEWLLGLEPLKATLAGDCGSCWAFAAVAAMEGSFNLEMVGSSPPAGCNSTCGTKKARALLPHSLFTPCVRAPHAFRAWICAHADAYDACMRVV